MSREQRLASIREAERRIDVHIGPHWPDQGEQWREGRRDARRREIVDAIGATSFTDEEVRMIEWVAGWDAETVAGIAALIDRARTSNDEIKRLRHLARCAADFREQISPDVNWPGVPPWTMRVVERLDEAVEWFDQWDEETP